MSLAAALPVADIVSANATLESGGWGPNSFRIPTYTNSVGATHSFFQANGTDLTAFYDAVKALPNVIVSEVEGPQNQIDDVLAQIGGQWGGDAPLLEGVVTPGLYQSATDAFVYYWVIQQYDTETWPDPDEVPALVRRARNPYVIENWVQPIDQFDAYKLLNEFTGLPDQVFHKGQQWVVTEADGAGNNVFEPGEFGWEVVT